MGPFVQLALEIRPELASLLASVRLPLPAFTFFWRSGKAGQACTRLVWVFQHSPDFKLDVLLLSRVDSDLPYYSDLVFGFVKNFGSHSVTTEIQRIFGSAVLVKGSMPWWNTEAACRRKGLFGLLMAATAENIYLEFLQQLRAYILNFCKSWECTSWTSSRKKKKWSGNGNWFETSKLAFSDIFPPARPCLLDLSKQQYQLGPSHQASELRGNILIQTTTEAKAGR